MPEFNVINNATFVQYQVKAVGGEYKVFSMNGNQANVSYADIERGLEANKYKKI